MNQNAVGEYYPDRFSGFLLATFRKCPVGSTGDVTAPGGSAAGFGIPFAQYTLRKFRVRNARDTNEATVSAAALVASVFTAASGGGTTLVSAVTFANLTTSAKYQEATLAAAAGTDVLSSATLYLNVGTAVAGAFVDVDIYGDPIPGVL